MLYKWCKVTVCMKKRQAAFNAIGGNERVHGLSNGEPTIPKQSIVFRSPDREFVPDEINMLKRIQGLLYQFELALVSNTLQDFSRDKVPHSKACTSEVRIE